MRRTLRQGLRWRGPGPVAAVLVGVLAMAPAQALRAECRVLEPEQDGAAAFSKRLSGDCTDADRRDHAVTASELLAALRQGRPIDLVNVLVTGDLRLDTLPTVTLEEALREASPPLRAALEAAPGAPLRMIRGRMAITGSRLDGPLVTGLREGHLIVRGPIALERTTFERVVDLSQAVFAGPVQVADATFLSDAYFVQAHFLDRAGFEGTAFAQRARFHRSRFLAPVTFDEARFSGMTELLEVQFLEGARFVEARFRLGTGFSGSRFGGDGDFSRSRFEREAFFLHTRFEAGARFEDATFLSLADFSQAVFLGTQDFSGAVFAKEPRFSGTVSRDQPVPDKGSQGTVVLYGLAGLLLALTVLVLWARRRGV